MNARHLLLIATLVAAVRVEAAPPAAKAVAKIPAASRTNGQFVVYCPDAPLRREIETLATTTKADVYELLGENSDRWKVPVVISVASSAAGPTRAASRWPR